MKLNKLTLTFFTMLLCGYLFAQGPRGGHGQGGGRGQGRGNQKDVKPDATEILSKLDTNSDGVIDKDEALKDERGKISNDFDEIDTNSDEVIDLDELKAALDDKAPKKVSSTKILKEVDDNNDGSLNELEVAAKNKRDLMDNFNDIDTNDDGELDLEELKAFYNKKNTSKRRKRDQITLMRNNEKEK